MPNAAGSLAVAEARTKTGASAVPRADPAQPPQDLGDVGAEDSAVAVALVPRPRSAAA
ncbi:hypothetical protein [Nonomuraea dietziae]|uniref:hypothetical protein n=1 Tax=Nonomuraea dietziae TaxID=65515 RepID=UPI0031CEA12B